MYLCLNQNCNKLLDERGNTNHQYRYRGWGKGVQPPQQKSMSCRRFKIAIAILLTVHQICQSVRPDRKYTPYFNLTFSYINDHHLPLSTICTCNFSCWSSQGKINGPSLISVGLGCEFRNVISHLIGHVVGLWHPHNRIDRGDYIQIFWQNIDAGKNFIHLYTPLYQAHSASGRLPEH